MTGWDNFFVAAVGAGATLTGLLFVAVSINLTRILAIPRLPGRAGETLLILTTPIVVSLCALIPRQPAAALGAEWLGIGVVVAATAATAQLGGGRSVKEPRGVRAMLAFVPTLGVAAGGALVLAHADAAAYVAAPAVIACLVSGVFNAWVLLVEIMR